MAVLDVYMNGYLIGEFTKTSTGAHYFSYHEDWLAVAGARPISLSMPLRRQAYKGDEVYNFFDNLLPDNPEVRNRIVARHQAVSSQPFDLLAKIGQDSVGALQLVPHGEVPVNVKQIESKALSEADLEKVLKGYLSGIPLGMLREQDEFRISIAGAQEKTALLNLNGQWRLPIHATPTTHIIKLPIGTIKGHSFNIDMSDSVENEFLCMKIAEAFGLTAAQCHIMKVGDIKALAVERFDRRFAADGSWIMRLPQEDFCQVLNVPPANKYESDGGPGIQAIMDQLLGSTNPERDRHDFMKAQVLFWLLGAIDGHAKNFSIFIDAGGSYRLAPLYDILSIYPALGGQGPNIRDVKLAMALKASKGKKAQLDAIFPRHFIQTAKAVGFDPDTMAGIMMEIADMLEPVIAKVRAELPTDFPEHIRESILNGLTERAKRLTAENIWQASR
ncbi:type II toxin-antitoxin system HipA family toxin [Shewanella sedimentimangrovi]|uniref:Type II toxin-antitoxin system HipA family toxin n=1 Tax=Shewanella sedimentimangrovi TaxID=2814293 RepID=A0ABX7R323_9GAMM|nr:type II toxin-antitoxin system HipA family toxin [Shewanella sedimentimangrovi]QSX37556.1 type II toxin-antitoxin system HipA family toxin [Shewanella sedimentimangrovi]